VRKLAGFLIALLLVANTALVAAGAIGSEQADSAKQQPLVPRDFSAPI
jgi:hypothetical protein